MFEQSNERDISALEDTTYTSYIYTDKADPDVLNSIRKELGHVDYIVRDKEDWGIRYVTSIIMDSQVNGIVIHDIDEMSIAEITLASFMCKTILCVTDTVTEYEKIYDMVTDLQTGCNLTINNNSFTNWYNTKRF